MRSLRMMATIEKGYWAEHTPFWTETGKPNRHPNPFLSQSASYTIVRLTHTAIWTSAIQIWIQPTTSKSPQNHSISPLVHHSQPSGMNSTMCFFWLFCIFLLLLFLVIAPLPTLLFPRSFFSCTFLLLYFKLGPLLVVADPLFGELVVLCGYFVFTRGAVATAACTMAELASSLVGTSRGKQGYEEKWMW